MARFRAYRLRRAISARIVVLAIGHSARDTYEMLYQRGVPMVQKPFQIGGRIEQPQEAVNRAQYGAARLEEKLGAADYTLVARGRTNVFSFCMCGRLCHAERIRVWRVLHEWHEPFRT